MQRDLVLRAQTGDHDAFATLATQAFDRLHRSARLILRDTDAASDAVQDALMAAWRDIRALRDPDRFDAWLYRLLVNGCYRAASRDRRPAGGPMGKGGRTSLLGRTLRGTEVAAWGGCIVPGLSLAREAFLLILPGLVSGDSGAVSGSNV